MNEVAADVKIAVWMVKDPVGGAHYYDDTFEDVADVIRNMEPGTEYLIRKEMVWKSDYENSPDY